MSENIENKSFNEGLASKSQDSYEKSGEKLQKGTSLTFDKEGTGLGDKKKVSVGSGTVLSHPGEFEKFHYHRTFR